MSQLVQAVLDFTALVGEGLADYTATIQSPIANNNLRMADGSPLALVLAQDANPGDTTIIVGGAGGVDIHGTLRAQTAITLNTEVVSSQGETSASFGTLTLNVSPSIGSTYLAGAAVSVSRITLSDIPVSTASTDKTPKDVYTTKLPEFGFVGARKLFSIRPLDGWSITATHRITGEVSKGRIGKVTGGAANIYLWVGDP